MRNAQTAQFAPISAILGLALLLVITAPAASEILTLVDANGNVGLLDGDNSLFRWDARGLVFEGEGAHPDDVEQFGDIREVGVETEGDGIFTITYTTSQIPVWWRADVPYTLSTEWTELSHSFTAIWEYEDVAPNELLVPRLRYYLRKTVRESFPPDSADGLVAQNITGDIDDQTSVWKSVPDSDGTMRAAFSDLETDDAVAWRVGVTQNWQGGFLYDLRVTSWGDFTVVPEPSSFALAFCAMLVIAYLPPWDILRWT